MECPNCSSRDTGRVGNNQYYCWNCFVLFSFDSKRRPRLYEVDTEGTLTALEH
ncbi:MAG: hypothetical protein GX090_08600 [Firmicutes bacterium]|nr:hypothetical protein [Bacillota bacterium]HOB35624.1 hypothetical protein [Bacillota bacterium]HPZ90797.1 hypothetical protein [Bacillota bacterium]HQE01753.1 hypothetical protein [Bacillota bacterium]